MLHAEQMQCILQEKIASFLFADGGYSSSVIKKIWSSNQYSISDWSLLFCKFPKGQFDWQDWSENSVQKYSLDTFLYVFVELEFNEFGGDYIIPEDPVEF